MLLFSASAQLFNCKSPGAGFHHATSHCRSNLKLHTDTAQTPTSMLFVCYVVRMPHAGMDCRWVDQSFSAAEKTKDSVVTGWLCRRVRKKVAVINRW